MGHLTVDYWTQHQHLHDLVNKGYLWEFVLNLRLPLEIRVHRHLETPPEHPGSALV